MTDVSRLLRGTLPCLVAVSVATAVVLPAQAQQLARPARAAGTLQVTRDAEWWLTALRVSGAWRAAPAEGKGVTVAVLSTGVDATHPDLAGDVTTGPDYADSGRSATGPFWGFEGTAVASLVAGHGHGSSAGRAGGPDGVTGVAPRARILSVQVTLEYNDPLNANPVITRRLANAIGAGIRYAVGHGAAVIALPLDPGTLGPAASGDPAAAGGSPAERAAVSYALAHNVVLVAPAGDNGAGTGTVNYPAAYPGVLAVGATGKDGRLAWFSSERSYVALTAPGSGLTVAAPGGGYASLASTDMSAALTAGVAALIRSRFPLLTAAEVTRALEAGTHSAAAPPAAGPGAAPGTNPTAGAGHGALDATAALAAAAGIAAVRPARTPTTGPTVTQAAAFHPSARPSAARQAAARRTGAGTFAGTLLRYGVIAACALIVALACALALTARRRRIRAERRAPPRTGQGGSHARKPGPAQERELTAGPRRDAWAQPRALGPASGLSRVETSGPGGSGSGPRIIPAGGLSGTETGGPGGVGGSGSGPRIVPASSMGTLGMTGRGPRKRKPADKPPWEAANPPPPSPPAPHELSAFPPIAPALPAGSGRPQAGQAASLAPWERSPEEFAAAPVPADLPEWSATNSGPMYLWNPNASTAPQPALRKDDKPHSGEGENERPSD